jgi:hypothetical protein
MPRFSFCKMPKFSPQMNAEKPAELFGRAQIAISHKGCSIPIQPEAVLRKENDVASYPSSIRDHIVGASHFNRVCVRMSATNARPHRQTAQLNQKPGRRVLPSVFQDLCHGLRTLASHPGLTIVAAL